MTGEEHALDIACGGELTKVGIEDIATAVLGGGVIVTGSEVLEIRAVDADLLVPPCGCDDETVFVHSGDDLHCVCSMRFDGCEDIACVSVVNFEHAVHHAAEKKILEDINGEDVTRVLDDAI